MHQDRDAVRELVLTDLRSSVEYSQRLHIEVPRGPRLKRTIWLAIAGTREYIRQWAEALRSIREQKGQNSKYLR